MNRALKSVIILHYGTQVDFAEHVGISPVIVSDVLNGRRKLNDEHKRRWSRALKIDNIDDLLTHDRTVVPA